MATRTSALDSKMAAGPGKLGMLVFGVALIIGFVYAGGHLISDLSEMHSADCDALRASRRGAPCRPGL